VARVAAAVEEHALPHGALGLEIAESCVIALGPSARPLLEELRSAGVALALDDFSSFYSTLGAIEVLPLDAIKLGHRYVRGVGELVGPDGEGDPLVAAVIDQAHSRGLYVVAEGVESWGEAARLTELGCDRAHGWLFSSAQHADKACWLLERGYGWQRAVPLPPEER
jgi:EAL domain-containing protein (putative c-di-GMP-specific phosphodiesterase class I)